jgi:hypothetical protein
MPLGYALCRTDEIYALYVSHRSDRQRLDLRRAPRWSTSVHACVPRARRNVAAAWSQNHDTIGSAV